MLNREEAAQEAAEKILGLCAVAENYAEIKTADIKQIILDAMERDDKGLAELLTEADGLLSLIAHRYCVTDIPDDLKEQLLNASAKCRKVASYRGRPRCTVATREEPHEREGMSKITAEVQETITGVRLWLSVSGRSTRILVDPNVELFYGDEKRTIATRINDYESVRARLDEAERLCQRALWKIQGKTDYMVEEDLDAFLAPKESKDAPDELNKESGE